MEDNRLGNYKILETIGSGGMGVVYKAEHVKLCRLVALKVIREKHAGRKAHLDRFHREAAVCAKLNHPNVIKLFDYGREDGRCYYAMEFIDAPTLKQIIDDEETPPNEHRLLAIASSLAQALIYIHGQDLIHRDIKPANIMVDGTGHVTLMDFGLVKAFQAEALTEEGKPIGTPRYMSPEMFKAESVDCRSDIFQLGIVLYEAATGRSPFTGKDVYSIAASIMNKNPRKLRKFNRKLSKGFETLVLNCLEKDPADRYRDAAELLEDLEKCRKRLPIQAKGSRKAAPNPEDTALVSDSAPSLPGASSTFDFTRISLPVDILRNAELGRIFFAAIMVVTLAAVAFLYTRSSSPAPVTVHDLRVYPDIGGAVVMFSTSRPCVNSLEFWPDTAPSMRRSINSVAASSGTTNHKFVLSGLSAGKTYSFEVLYPGNGKSLPHSFTVPCARNLQIERFAFKFTAIDRVELNFETNLPCVTSLSYVLSGESRRLEISTRPSRSHHVSLEAIPVDSAIVSPIITMKTETRVVKLARSDIPAPSRWLAGLGHSVARFDPQAAVSVTERLFREGPKKITLGMIENQLGRDKGFRYFLRYGKIFKAAFSCAAPALDDFRIDLYRSLRNIEHVDAYLEEKKTGLSFGVMNYYRPYVDLSWSSERPSGRSVVIFSLSEALSSFIPDVAAEGSAVGFSLLKMYGSTEKATTRRKYEVSVDLKGFPSSCCSRPRLVLRCRNLTPAFFVRVTVNNKYFVDFRNTEKSVPPELYLWDRHEKTVESEEYKKSVNYVSARVSRTFFRDGLNHFMVRLHTYPGFRTLNWVQLRELRLYRE